MLRVGAIVGYDPGHVSVLLLGFLRLFGAFAPSSSAEEPAGSPATLIAGRRGRRRRPGRTGCRLAACCIRRRTIRARPHLPRIRICIERRGVARLLNRHVVGAAHHGRRRRRDTTGIVGRIASSTAHRSLAAKRTSGPRFMKPMLRSIIPGFVRFSASYFMRAAAAGSAPGNRHFHLLQHVLRFVHARAQRIFFNDARIRLSGALSRKREPIRL